MSEAKDKATTTADPRISELRWTANGRGSLMAKVGSRVLVMVDCDTEPWRSAKGAGPNYVYATGGRSTVIIRDGVEHEVRFSLNAIEAVPENLL